MLYIFMFLFISLIYNVGNMIKIFYVINVL